MAQKVTGYIKLQIPAGKATPAPPVGPALGQHGVNIMAFTKEFNERTQKDIGYLIPVVITVYADRSFSFITKTPPGGCPYQEGCRYRERFRRAQQDEGRVHHEEAAGGDRQHQNARPERGEPGDGHQHDRRHLPQHGRYGHRLTVRITTLPLVGRIIPVLPQEDIMNHGKHYVDSKKLVDRTKLYDTEEALALCCQTAKAKFDETVELHVRRALTAVTRTSRCAAPSCCPTAPARTWVRVIAIAKGDAAKAAEEAGAMMVGDADLVAKIQNEGFIDFDVLVTTPDMMGPVGRLGKVWPPRPDAEPQGRYGHARCGPRRYRGEGR